MRASGLAHPDEVLLTSNKYKKAFLCDFYCTKQCHIVAQYVPEVRVKKLSQIVLETITSLNPTKKQKSRLIEW